VVIEVIAIGVVSWVVRMVVVWPTVGGRGVVEVGGWTGGAVVKEVVAMGVVLSVMVIGLLRDGREAVQCYA
jgi:hypothetical protein